jgi:hypothetical protein
LREALEFAYPIYRPGGIVGSPAFGAEIDGWPVTPSSDLAKFLKRENEPDKHYLLQRAAMRASTFEPQPIIARAILLLRLASAECAALLRAASVAMPDLSYWWKEELQNHGILDPPSVNDWPELWDDVGAAKELIEDWLAVEPDPTQFRAVRFIAEHVAVSQFHRCGLWLLAL